MSYAPYPGAAFLVPSGPNADQMHLFAVVTKRCSAGAHLLLSVSSVRDGRHHDPACLVEHGEHSFVTRRSYVVYRDSIQRPASLIANYVEKGIYVLRDDLSPELLNRYLVGLMSSEFTRPWAERYSRENIPAEATGATRAAFRIA